MQKSSELAQRYGRDVGLLENAITDMKSLVTMEQAKCKEFHAAVVAKEKELAEVRECVYHSYGRVDRVRASVGSVPVRCRANIDEGVRANVG